VFMMGYLIGEVKVAQSVAQFAGVKGRREKIHRNTNLCNIFCVSSCSFYLVASWPGSVPSLLCFDSPSPPTSPFLRATRMLRAD